MSNIDRRPPVPAAGGRNPDLPPVPAAGRRNPDLPPVPAAGGRKASPPPLLTFQRLKWGSFIHSVIYTGLLITAIADVLPELKTVLGWAHGIGWIAMTVAALIAARGRVIPLRLAVAIAVLGGVGPFFGSLEFLRLQRRARRDRGGMVDVAWQ